LALFLCPGERRESRKLKERGKKPERRKRMKLTP
jgi:hypothetical protein